MATTQTKPEITANEIRAKLEAAGIRRGCDWSDFERAEAIIIGDRWFDDSHEYDRIKVMISDILDL